MARGGLQWVDSGGSIAVLRMGAILAIGVINIWPNSVTDNELGVAILVLGIYGYMKSKGRR